MPRISTILTASSFAVALKIASAAASQGPGTLPGTASPFTQIAMAILVYGLSAGIVALGLIGAARKR